MKHESSLMPKLPVPDFQHWPWDDVDGSRTRPGLTHKLNIAKLPEMQIT